jgi:hypothetical protein
VSVPFIWTLDTRLTGVVIFPPLGSKGKDDTFDYADTVGPLAACDNDVLTEVGITSVSA